MVFFSKLRCTRLQSHCPELTPFKVVQLQYVWSEVVYHLIEEWLAKNKKKSWEDFGTSIIFEMLRNNDICRGCESMDEFKQMLSIFFDIFTLNVIFEIQIEK